MPPAPEQESEEEAVQRKAEHEQHMAEYEAEQQRRKEERKAEYERQQKEYEAEQKRREQQHKARLGTLERIVEHAPAAFDAAQLRLFVELLLDLSPCGLFEEAAEHFVAEHENNEKTDDQILSEALAACADDKLMGFVLRLLLTVHTDIPRGDQPDLLAKAETVFVPAKAVKSKGKQKAAAVPSAGPKKSKNKAA